MSDPDRADVLARTHAVQRMAQLEQHQMPPVPTSDAQEFARLMQRQQQRKGELPREENEQRSLGWDRLKQSAFRFAARILDPDTYGRGRRLDESRNWKDLPDGARPHQQDVPEAGPLTGRGLLMRLGASLFRDRAASDLSHDLSECVRHAEFLGPNWRMEVMLSTQHLPATRMQLQCGDDGLNLRFSCSDPRALAMLRNNRMLLMTRLGAVSARPVTIDIDEVTDAGTAISVAGNAAGGQT